jgi:hypothetical protein
LTLDQIPLDAEYVGAGPLYLWDAAAGVWVSSPLLPAPAYHNGAGDPIAGWAGRSYNPGA